MNIYLHAFSALTKLLFASVVFFAPLVSLANADTAKELVQKTWEKLGGPELHSFQYTYSGTENSFGQSYEPLGKWPAYSIESKTRSINLHSFSWREDLPQKRSRNENPARGGGEPSGPRGPIFVKGEFAWIQIAQNYLPNPWAYSERLHQLLATPHAVLKHAFSQQLALAQTVINGEKISTVSFTDSKKIDIKITIDQNLFVKQIDVQFIVNSYGKVNATTRFNDYRKIQSIYFPYSIKQEINGFETQNYAVETFIPKFDFDPEIPEKIQATNLMQNLTPILIGDGIYLIAGSHNVVAIEMDKHFLIVDAPLTNEYTKRVFDAIKKINPSKPIRYVVNTHHHVDHFGGVAHAFIESSTVITHYSNEELYKKYFPQINTQLISAPILFVKDQIRFEDSKNTVLIIHAKGNNHASDMLMVYLPNKKILIQADMFSSSIAGPVNSNRYDPFVQELFEIIKEKKISIEKIIPLHGPIVSYQEFLTIVNSSAK